MINNYYGQIDIFDNDGFLSTHFIICTFDDLFIYQSIYLLSCLFESKKETKK